MTLANNDGSVRKSLAAVDSSFSSFMFVSIEPFLKAKERKAHRFTISYSQTKNTPVNHYFTSSDFVVGGFNWYIKYFPQGVPDAFPDCIGLYLFRRSPSGPVVAMLSFRLLYGTGEPAVWSRELMCSFVDSKNYWGWPAFQERLKLEEFYIQNDNFVIDCELAVYEIPEEASKSLVGTGLSSELQRDLGILLEAKEMTDITFLVEGEMIPAHRVVLAARSPVLKATLYGPMSESREECVPIADMKALVFKAMLHYIYTDSLPMNETLASHEQSDNCTDETDFTMQHLLEAADRYGLERLKMICEERLCQTLIVDTVAATLALAHQHGCNQLKAACLEYIVDPRNYVSVTLTQGFLHLMQSCPEVMQELRGRIGQPSVLQSIMNNMSGSSHN